MQTYLLPQALNHFSRVLNTARESPVKLLLATGPAVVLVPPHVYNLSTSARKADYLELIWRSLPTFLSTDLRASVANDLQIAHDLLSSFSMLVTAWGHLLPPNSLSTYFAPDGSVDTERFRAATAAYPIPPGFPGERLVRSRRLLLNPAVVIEAAGKTTHAVITHDDVVTFLMPIDAYDGLRHLPEDTYSPLLWLVLIRSADMLADLPDALACAAATSLLSSLDALVSHRRDGLPASDLLKHLQAMNRGVLPPLTR